MINLLTSDSIAQQQAILNVINKPPAQVIEVELTLDQKIKSNFYKCNTDIEWIRADNAQCLAKPVATVQAVSKTTQTQKTVRTAQNSSGNTYTPGQCTHFAKTVLGWVPNGWGDATNWAANAQAQGYTLSSTPKVGAVAWRSGHVAAVIGVGDGTVTITEQNYDWNSGIRTITIPVDSYQYIY